MKKMRTTLALIFVIIFCTSNSATPTKPYENHTSSISYFLTSLKLVGQNIFSTNGSIKGWLKMFCPCPTNYFLYSKYDKALLKNMFAPSEVLKQSEEVQVTWIGHSTVLIQGYGFNILTDPIFGDVNKVFYTRNIAPGIALEKLPQIHYIVVSHNHRDHLGVEVINYFANPDFTGKRPTLLVPKGDKSWICKKYCYPANLVLEFDYDSDTKIDSSKKDVFLGFTFLPAIHTSGRGLLDCGSSACGSWMIEFKKEKKVVSIYFGGDTAYGPHFKAIAKIYNKINLAILPIGPNEPKATMKELLHMSAEEAWQAFIDLNAQYIMPIHFATFQQGQDRPLDALVKLMTVANKNKSKILTFKIGERKKPSA
jgi:L-ascorbate metabolism protein UlaG (beta-lactamase superfamily)